MELITKKHVLDFTLQLKIIQIGCPIKVFRIQWQTSELNMGIQSFVALISAVAFFGQIQGGAHVLNYGPEYPYGPVFEYEPEPVLYSPVEIGNNDGQASFPYGPIENPWVNNVDPCHSTSPCHPLYPCNKPFPVPTPVSFPVPPPVSFPIPPSVSFPIPPQVSFPIPPSVSFPVQPPVSFPIPPPVSFPIPPPNSFPIPPPLSYPIHFPVSYPIPAPISPPPCNSCDTHYSGDYTGMVGLRSFGFI